MVFSDLIFLYIFLCCFLIVYFLTPKRFKNLCLLVFSLIFYGWGEPKLVFLMIFSVLQGYIFGLLIEKHKGSIFSKIFAVSSTVLSVGTLFLFKYANFFADSFNAVFKSDIPLLKVALPIGISFYTFQMLSYIIDVYKGKSKAQRSFINLATYITMFPQLIAGPIVRYENIADSLENRKTSLDDIAYGTRRFIFGLSKKVILANELYALCESFKSSSDKSVLFFWIYAVSCALYIYFDFSAYSDMAIGLGRILGFKFLENFNYPFIAKSISEFWRRWHISLGTWFRDYIYIPLGGSRVTKKRLCLNLLIVWLLTGLWHGASFTFLLWGAIFALLLINEKLWFSKILDKAKFIRRIYVLFFVVLSFVLFDSETVSEAFKNIGSMLFLDDYPLVSEEAIYYLKSYAIIILVSLIGATPLLKVVLNKLKDNSVAKAVLNIIEPFVISSLLILSTAYIIDSTFNPFLYFRF